MQITKIRIENIKGKAKLEKSFAGLCSNKVNLFVAPNGFGKSTITAAFSAAMSGKMRLKKEDYYEQNKKNIPKLIIEYKNDDGSKEIVVSDDKKGEISKCFYVDVIKNPVYAKASHMKIKGKNASIARSIIKDVEVCKKRKKVEISYTYKEMKKIFKKNTPNLSNFLNSKEGLQFLNDHISEIKKCGSQKRISSVLKEINSENASRKYVDLLKYSSSKKIMEDLQNQFRLSCGEQVCYLIQFVYLCDEVCKKAKDSLKYVEYKEIKKMLDERLKEFNTTGLKLQSKVSNEKLYVKFGNASRMSNGERDVLYFITRLLKFSISVEKKPCILVIDEIFDYLDGTNLLAAQFYLSQELTRLKTENKIVFPILMTHLDPAVFSNYCFKKMAIHYLTNKSKLTENDKIVKLLKLRNRLKKEKNEKASELEMYLLHFFPDNWPIPDEILSQLGNGFWNDSYSYICYLYSEITEKYLEKKDYNALAVIIGLRIKIEERIVEMLPESKKIEYYNKHGSKKKFRFAEEVIENGDMEIPEIFYLLRPLYNEVLHLGDDWNKDKNKIESAYLKLSSIPIREMIRKIFSASAEIKTY